MSRSTFIKSIERVDYKIAVILAWARNLRTREKAFDLNESEQKKTSMKNEYQITSPLFSYISKDIKSFSKKL